MLCWIVGAESEMQDGMQGRDNCLSTKIRDDFPSSYLSVNSDGAQLGNDIPGEEVTALLSMVIRRIDKIKIEMFCRNVVR